LVGVGYNERALAREVVVQIGDNLRVAAVRHATRAIRPCQARM
jgi:hypothetical protein